ncbi:MAG TPA: hypothetical protein PK299_03365 [Anaerolineales bacterium]|nr:hypothetical protein [Anaerolineales bacterium]
MVIIVCLSQCDKGGKWLGQGYRMKKAFVFNVWVLISGISRLKLLE